MRIQARWRRDAKVVPRRVDLAALELCKVDWFANLTLQVRAMNFQRRRLKHKYRLPVHFLQRLLPSIEHPDVELPQGEAIEDFLGYYADQALDAVRERDTSLDILALGFFTEDGDI